MSEMRDEEREDGQSYTQDIQGVCISEKAIGEYGTRFHGSNCYSSLFSTASVMSYSTVSADLMAGIDWLEQTHKRLQARFKWVMQSVTNNRQS
jgi:hypothetical protein